MDEGEIREILLLDDDTSVLLALKLLLKALGFSVTEFSSPREAIECLKRKERKFDLFLCDLKMPELSGLMVLESAQKIRPELPFVLMSAHAGNNEISKAKEAGACGFLAKPFSPAQLHETVAKAKEWIRARLLS